MSTTRTDNEKLQRLSHVSVEQAVDGILWVDSTAHFYRANKAICQMLGYSQEEMLGLTIPDINPDYRDGDLLMHLERAQNGVTCFETCFRKKDGQIFPVELTVNFIEEFEGGSYHCTFVRDISERKRSEAALQRSHDQLRQALEGTITAITRAVEARDLYVAGHQRRVAQLACAIANELELTAEQIEGIHMGAMIHDIGKIHLPAEILGKPAHLLEAEFALVKSHPEVGFEILKDIEFPWPVAEIAHQHHEHLDGSGYPQGLVDNEILLEARIVCVADVVEAMACHRPYRPALGIERALAEIEKNSGVFYDQVVVAACQRLFLEKKFTFEVELRT